MKSLLAILVVAALGGVSYAYPQYQLSRDATCTGCHISPDGGGTLNENGLAVAGSTAWKEGSNEFMYGMSLPGWLQLDGHVRAAAGYVQPGIPRHVVYTQRFGGRPLYGEAYALAASYIDPKFEVHASGFVHDPITSAVEKGDGGAIYAETRLGEHAAIGVEGKYSKGDDVTALYGGLTGKLYLPGPGLLLLTEGQVVRREITAGAGDKATQLVGYAMGSHELGSGFLLDVGVGHFTQDTRVKGLYRDCVDANLHWFMTSHVEWLLTTRLELLDAASGPTGAYALAQIHYRI